MKRTRVCDILGVQYPIIQGGMSWLANAELAAAVSNADALGVISPNAGMERHGNSSINLEKQIEKVRELTAMPFGVNVPPALDESGILIDTPQLSQECLSTLGKARTDKTRRAVKQLIRITQ